MAAKTASKSSWRRNRVVDVEDISTGSGVEDRNIRIRSVPTRQLLQQRHVVAGQRDHQVDLDVVDADLRGAMVGQERAGAAPGWPAVGALADMPAGGACLVTGTVVVQPVLADLVGEHLSAIGDRHCRRCTRT